MAITKKKSATNPCWEGYEKIGMKKKGGKLVPDCVPIKKASVKKAASKKVFAKKAATKKSVVKKTANKKSATKKSGG